MRFPKTEKGKRYNSIYIKIICVLFAVFLAVKFYPCQNSGTEAMAAEAEEDMKDNGSEAGEKVVRVGYYNDDGTLPLVISDKDKKHGYAYEYYQEISKYTGWIYEYEYGNRTEIYDKLIRGDVDIIAEVTKGDGREDKMLFSDYAMGSATYYIYAPDASTAGAEITPSILDGKRIGVKANTYMGAIVQKFTDENNIECKILPYEGLEERKQAIENGELDFIVTVENDRMEGYNRLFNVGSSDYYFAVNRNREDILQELNVAQREILSDFPFYISRLEDKYYNRSKVQRDMNEKEKKWLEEHKEIKVGYLNEYMPFCDKNEQSGEMQGILSEILNYLSEYTKVDFTCTSYDDYDVMIQALKDGEVDLIFPTFGDLWYSETQGYTQTISIVSTQVSVVYRGDYSNSIYDSVAVYNGSPQQSFYLSINYPDSEQHIYKNWEECLSAVQKGDVGCMLVNSDVIHRYLNEHNEFSDLHVAELEEVIDFCFAVRRSDIILYSIINKVVNNIDDTLIRDAVVRNSYVEAKYTLRDFLVDNIGIVAILVIGFILLLILFFTMYGIRAKRDWEMLQASYNREKKYIADKEEYFNIIGFLVRIYEAAYYINISEEIYQQINNMEFKSDQISFDMDDSEITMKWIDGTVKEDYRDKLSAFMDISTIADRMKTVDNLSMEYELEDKGWYRCCFISGERDSDGKLTCVLFAVQEINEEKEAQQWAQVALREAYEAASSANQAKSNFLSRMSHDIRTPMNAIIGMTAIASAHIDEKERVEDCLKKITSSGKHLLTLINEVLDMSKIESGKMEFTEEEFNLQELIYNMLNIVQPQIEERKHEIKVYINDLLHDNVIGDSLHMEQVFLNIIGNAIKYTPKGGKINLYVTEKVTNQENVGCYEFIFEDNGIGMSEEFVQHVFDPFSRENESKNSVQGTGLGLSIVLNIVRMMGGDIKVESEQGKGSRFIVTMYFQLQDDDVISFKDAVKFPVLVIDDNQEACESTCMILDELGIDSEWVLDGYEAVKRIEETYNADKQYFAVILDWKMPKMDGIETAKAIRNVVGDDITIIIQSAYDWSEIEEEAKKANISNFISKPLFKSRLAYLFKRLVNGESDNNSSYKDSIDGARFDGKRILLVEDNEINAEIAKEILESMGLEVEHVWDGQEAVNKLKETRQGYYDLVFMDIQMPVMDGYEATKQIRAINNREDLKDIPIIAMSANAFAEDVQFAMRAGMNYHIAKPLDVKKIIATLKKWLDKS